MFSLNMFRHYIVLLIVLIAAETGLAIHCWQCNSARESHCTTLPSGVQDKASLSAEIRDYYVDCDQRNDSFKYTLCRKQEQEIDKEVRIIRGCGLYETPGKKCYSTANPPVKTLVCECNEDGCNLGTRLPYNTILVVISLFLSILFSKNIFYK